MWLFDPEGNTESEFVGYAWNVAGPTHPLYKLIEQLILQLSKELTPLSFNCKTMIKLICGVRCKKNNKNVWLESMMDRNREGMAVAI